VNFLGVFIEKLNICLCEQSERSGNWLG